MGNSESNRKQPNDGPQRLRPRRPRATARDPCPSTYFYQVLGVEQTATSSEIRVTELLLSCRPFRPSHALRAAEIVLKRVVEAHPDKNLDDPDGAAKRFRVVQQAYDVLSDNDKRAEYDHAPRDFHLEIADYLDGGDDDEEDSDDNYDDAYSNDEPIYEPAPRFWFNPWGTEHTPKKQAYESPTGVIDIKEMVEFFDSLAGLPWSDRAPNSAYTRISTFYTRLAADDARFCLGNAPTAVPPAFGDARGIFWWGVDRDEERARLDMSSPEVHKFYSYWMGFRCASGRYAWVEPYDCGCRMQGCPSARANRRVQEGMRGAFAEVVRPFTLLLWAFHPETVGARTPPELYGTKILDTLTINSNPQIHSTP
ncbi:hypothetical protein B0H19DRAFT_1062972 [Mycena capillaripes]|nr:hypothetical protein B0H19DRAFT_1062972 [Mycena capillaripes]